MSFKAIFLDRDGVINVEKNYVYKISDFEFNAGTIEALKKIPKDYKIIIVTNQGGISKGYYTAQDFHVLSSHMTQILKDEGIKIDGIYHCPHHDEDKCECRKPGNKMLLDAKTEHDIDFENSYMIGDKLHDISAGKKSGCKTILVRTGHGTEEEKMINEKNVYPDHVADDLLDAINWIFENKPPVFILAAGLGTRLGDLTKDKPKPMMDINGKPFLEYIIQKYRIKGFEKFILCVGYKSEVIKEYFGNGSRFGVSIEYSTGHKPLGTAGEIKNAKKLIGKETFIVMNGDTYMDMDLSSAIQSHHEKKATVTIICCKSNDEGRSGGILIENDKIISFDEKVEHSLINAGIYICEPRLADVLEYFEAEQISFERDVFPKLLKDGELFGFITENQFTDIGIPQSLEKFRIEMK